MGQAGETDGVGAGRRVMHATAVAHNGRALAFTGPSGAGKSALALEMIGLGARLVSDDRVIVTRTADGLVADAPDTIRGLIEVRGVGVLRLDPVGPMPLVALVDLSREATTRLPQKETATVLGHNIPLYCRIGGAHFASALLHVLAGAHVDL